MVCEAAQHDADHGELDEGDGGCGEGFIVPREPAATGEPSQRALDDPASRQHGEAFLAIIAFDDLDGEAAARAEGSGEPGTGIGLIGEQMGQPGEQPACVADEVRCPVSVLNVGGADGDGEHQPAGVDQEVALDALDLLGRIEADRVRVRPPFSAAFTDWLSMIPAVGLASRPSHSRHASSSA